MSVFLLVLVFINTAHSARILGIFPTPSVSHQSVFRPIWKELSLRGHQVTVITPNPLKDSTLENLTEVDVSFVYKEQASHGDIKIAKKISCFKTMQIAYLDGFATHELILNFSGVRNIINNGSEHFDIVIAEGIQPVYYAFARRFNCPLVIVLSLDELPQTGIANDMSSHPLVYPTFLSSNDNTDFIWQRIDKLWNLMKGWHLYFWTVLPMHDTAVNKYFGSGYPPIGDIERNASLVLLTKNIFLTKPKPYPPHVISIWGTIPRKNLSLSQDLQAYLDSAVNGAVYLSFGSSVKCELLDKDKIQQITQAVSHLPYKVLWKYENETLPGKPENVLTRKWFPQQAVLAHKNVKVFVTQGGLQSIEEAILNRVPMVGISMTGDQHFNIHRLVKLGVAESVDFDTFTAEELEISIEKVMHNSSYQTLINEIADALEDEPITGLQKATFWIEYVIRHKGARFLRNDTLNIPLYQYYFIDIIVLALIIVIVLLYISIKLLQAIKNIIFVQISSVKKKNL